MARQTLVAITSLGIVLGGLFFAAVVGDFLLGRAIDKRAEAAGGEGRRLMNERYQTQDRAMIAQAAEDGFSYRILLPLVVEKRPSLVALADAAGFAPLGLEPDAQLFICNEGHGALMVETDRFGFRNRDDVWDAPQADMVLVGDSFAFGLCQDDARTIAGNLLEQRVLNLSFPGAGPVHYAAIIRTFGPHVRSDRVVLLFYSNDRMPVEVSRLYHDWFFGPDADVSDFFQAGAPLRPSAGHREIAVAARDLIDAEVGAVRPAGQGALARQFARVRKVLSHADFPALRGQIEAMRTAGRDRDEGSRLAIETLSTHCRETGCTPLVAYIPNSPFWDPDPGVADYPKVLSGFAQKYDVEFLDLSTVISETGRPAYSDAGIHLSGLGYGLVADALKTHFASQGAAN